MSWNRWEWLERLEPETLVEAAVRHLAALVADRLVDWPPEVAVPSAGPGAAGGRYAAVLEPGARRPSLEVYKEALKRARWELERDFDAIDYYERNHLLARACPDERDQRAAELIQHYVLEAFYVLPERTDYRVKRADLIPGIDLLEKAIVARIAPAAN